MITICLLTTFAAAQKTVRKRPKLQAVLPSTEQISPDSDQRKSQQFSAPVEILDKPRAAYRTLNRGTFCIQGKVVLKVQFLESGKIGTIFVISRLPYVTPNAIEAAKKIKFIPAIKDGKPVTTFKAVAYEFGLF